MAKGDPIWQLRRWEERITALEDKIEEIQISRPSDKAKVDNAIEVIERLVDVMSKNSPYNTNTITIDHDWGYRMGTLLKELKA